MNDIVVTTYERVRIEGSVHETTMTDFVAKQKDPSYYKNPTRGHCPLMVILWNLIFLDEAHRLANPKSGISKAANRLRGKARVPMTGTPLQNEYRDLQSMMRFLKIEP